MATSSERMLDLLLNQFENKPVIKAILEVIGEEFDRHEQIKKDLAEKIWPHTAVGKQLDICGEVADISRTTNSAIASTFFGFPNHGNNGFGKAVFRRYVDPYLQSNEMTDSVYRYAILNKIYKNNTDCSRQSTVDSIKKMFNVDKVIAVNAGNAKMRIGIGRKITNDEMNLIDELDLIIKGAGIGVAQIYTFNDTDSKYPTFGFSRNGESIKGLQGFGVGVFARVYR